MYFSNESLYILLLIKNEMSVKLYFQTSSSNWNFNSFFHKIKTHEIGSKTDMKWDKYSIQWNIIHESSKNTYNCKNKQTDKWKESSCSISCKVKLTIIFFLFLDRHSELLHLIQLSKSSRHVTSRNPCQSQFKQFFSFSFQKRDSVKKYRKNNICLSYALQIGLLNRSK